MRHFPFEHLVIENFLDDDFYLGLKNNLPLNEQLDTLEKVRGTKGYDQRYVCSLKKNQPIASSEKINTYYVNSLTEELLSNYFANALIAKFPAAAQRAQKKINDEGKGLAIEAYFVNDRSGYALGPHTDTPNKLITGLLYFPDEGAPDSLGTSLYVRKGAQKKQDTGNLHLDKKDFLEVFRVPFKQNTALFFARSSSSFHGVEGPIVHPRKLIIMDIFITK